MKWEERRKAKVNYPSPLDSPRASELSAGEIGKGSIYPLVPVLIGQVLLHGVFMI